VNLIPTGVEDQLFLQLRTLTVQRLRAAERGDRGICVLLERLRKNCLAELAGRQCKPRRRLLHAA
jgi:hypothetical protein